MALLLTATTQAKQLSFTKKAQEDSYTFSYQWLDHSNARQTIHFSLSKSALFERFRTLNLIKVSMPKKPSYAQ